MKKSLKFFYLALAIFFVAMGYKSLSNDDEWEYIFNGNNLDDWTVKIKGYKKAIVTLKKGQSIDLTTGI